MLNPLHKRLTDVYWGERAEERTMTRPKTRPNRHPKVYTLKDAAEAQWAVQRFLVERGGDVACADCHERFKSDDDVTYRHYWDGTKPEAVVVLTVVHQSCADRAGAPQIEDGLSDKAVVKALAAVGAVKSRAGKPARKSRSDPRPSDRNRRLLERAGALSE